MNTAIRRGRILAETLIVVLAVSLAAVLAKMSDAQTTTPGTQAASLTATVRSVDQRRGTLELLTGVGHSLRITHVQLPPRSSVTARRRTAATSSLAPGSIVRIEYTRTAKGMVASAIEVLQPPPTAPKP